MNNFDTMNDEIFKDIESFIKEVRWNYPFELQRETRIEQDLRITGVEAYEFIDAFSKQFNVNVTNFKFDSYFESEGDLILPALVRFFTRKKNKDRKVLTLGDLEKAVELKELL